MATLEQLSELYLRTPDGDTPGEPCGFTGHCTYEDRVQWSENVIAIRGQVVRVLDRNKQVSFSNKAREAALAFVADAFFVKRYPSMFNLEPTAPELARKAQAGVAALAMLHEQAEAKGGTVPELAESPEPTELDLFPGPDAYWWVGIGAFAVVALLLWKR